MTRPTRQTAPLSTESEDLKEKALKKKPRVRTIVESDEDDDEDDDVPNLKIEGTDDTSSKSDKPAPATTAGPSDSHNVKSLRSVKVATMTQEPLADETNKKPKVSTTNQEARVDCTNKKRSVQECQDEGTS